MKKIKILLFATLILYFSSLSAFEKEIFCEPSLIFPEIFLIESAHTFSYTLADTFYKDSDALFNYLNSVDFSQEQFTVRYIYYLRTRQFMPALMLMMTMVNLNAYPSSFPNPYDEFFNLLQMAANDINEHASGSDTFSFEDPDISGENERYVRSLLSNDSANEPMTAADLSGKMTAEIVINFAAVNMRNKRLGRENKITLKTVFFILGSSFKTILSNIENGVNLENDPFFKELFNRFVAMHKDEKEILSSFVYNFVEKIYGLKKDVGLYRYILLRQFGMIENAAESWLDFKDVTAAVKWIDSVKTIENIEPFSSHFVKNEDACRYIAEKTDWIFGMKHLSNESKKEIAHTLKLAGMIEQCGDLDYIGLEKKEENGDEKPYPEWARYAAYALKTVTEQEMSEEEAVKILKKGLSAAIFSIKPETEAEKDMYEIMLFIYRHEKCDEVLKAIFLKQITHGNIDRNASLYRDAVQTLDDFLFY
ncbi:hypothetical protein II898_03400 [bacterium]|nr:hypothetical protein [bacterium]